jgi:hypothetical protein
MTKNSFANMLVDWESFIKKQLKIYNAKTGDDIGYDEFCKHLISVYDKHNALVRELERLMVTAKTPDNADTRISISLAFFMLEYAILKDKGTGSSQDDQDDITVLDVQKAPALKAFVAISEDLSALFDQLLYAVTTVTNLILNGAIRLSDKQFKAVKKGDKYLLKIDAAPFMLALVERPRLFTRSKDVLQFLVSGISTARSFCNNPRVDDCTIANGEFHMLVTKECYDIVKAERDKRNKDKGLK